MSMKRGATLAVLWAAVGTCGREGIGFFIFLVLARILGPEAYGLVGMALAVVAVGQVFLINSLEPVIVQRQDLEPGHLDAAFWSLVGLAALLMLVAIGAAPAVASMFGEPEVAKLVWWLSGLPVLQALSAVPIALLTRRMRFDILAARSVLAVVGGGAVGIGMALTGQGAFSLVGHLLTQAILSLLVLWTASDWRPGFRVRRRYLRDLRVSGFYMLGIRFMILIEQQVPRVLIGYFFGATSLGIYTLSSRILDILFLVSIRPVHDVMLPIFARLQGDLQRFRQLLSVGQQLCAMVAFPVFIGLVLVAPLVIPMLLGQRWQDAVVIVQLLGLQGILLSIASVSSPIPQAFGRWDVTLIERLLMTFLITTAIVSGRGFGLSIVVGTMVAATYLMVPVYFYIVQCFAKAPVLEQLVWYRSIVVAVVAMAVAVHVWGRVAEPSFSDISLLATSILIGALVYCGVLGLVALPLIRKAKEICTSLWRGSATTLGADISV
jgi:O-antigen/teichoic acid export membrane protein